VCSVSIKFSPPIGGPYTASLTINYEMPGSPFVTTLSGTAVGQPAETLAPASLNFGNQVVGTPSAPQMVTISNSGASSLSLFSVTLTNTADYSITSTCSSNVVNTGASCSVAITFTPTAAGNLSGSLVIATNFGSGQQTIPLSGTGTNFVISPVTGSSSSATVPAGQSATYQLGLSPQVYSGTVNLTCSEVTTIPDTTCMISANPVILSGNTPVTVTITVTTTAKSAAAVLRVAPHFRLRFPDLGPSGFATIRWFLVVMMSMALVVTVRNARRKIPVAISAALLFTMLATGCGAAGNTGGGSGITPPAGLSGTPAGTYQLLVTASSSGVTRTTILSLIVT
jgi:hypothetical protein